MSVITTFANMIDEDYLKNNTPITKNVDVAELVPFMKDTQNRYVQDILGTKFYNHLMSQIIAEQTTPGTLTANEIEVLKMVRSMLMWYICYDALPFINWKLRNKGVLEGNGDNLNNADASNMSYLRNICKNNAEFYQERLQNYLCKYGSLYPTYQNADWDMYPNKDKTYSCGIVLDHFDDIQKWNRRHLL